MTFMKHLSRLVRNIVYNRKLNDSGKFIEFTDDYMFCTVMENEEYCREFLERVLGITIAEL